MMEGILTLLALSVGARIFCWLFPPERKPRRYHWEETDEWP